MSKTPAEARADYLAMLERQANDQSLDPAIRALAADRLAQEQFTAKVDVGLTQFAQGPKPLDWPPTSGRLTPDGQSSTADGNGGGSA